MKQYMVLAKVDGKWEHLPLWNSAGEDDGDALVSLETATQVAADWTVLHGVQCRIVSVA